MENTSLAMEAISYCFEVTVQAGHTCMVFNLQNTKSYLSALSLWIYQQPQRNPVLYVKHISKHIRSDCFVCVCCYTIAATKCCKTSVLTLVERMTVSQYFAEY